jgi:hypothetical protein
MPRIQSLLAVNENRIRIYAQPPTIMEQVKVMHYIMKHLWESERTRYFPVKPKTFKGEI